MNAVNFGVFAFILLAAPGLAYAAAALDPDRLAAAEAVFALTGGTENLRTGAEAMLELTEIQARDLGLSPAAKAELREIYRRWFEEDIDHARIRDGVVRLYAERFTTEELTELIAFYKTPLGAKTIRLLPEITHASARLGLAEAHAKESRLLARLEPFMKKYLGHDCAHDHPHGEDCDH